MKARTNLLFNFRINYNRVEGNTAVQPLYNGNIAQTFWKSENTDKNIRGYGYSYDGLNRILRADSYRGNKLSTMAQISEHDVQGISYDRNGNIKTLSRMGANEALVPSFGLWDNLAYTYTGNQLTKVVDQARGPHKDFGFKDGSNQGDDYLYDVNGNMTKDLNKGIFNITYNHLNLPVDINFDENSTIPSIQYKYDATGTKLEKSVKDGTTITTQYAGGFIYNNNGGDQKLQFFSHPEGYVEPVGGTERSVKGFEIGVPGPTYSSYNYVFQYKDHLGNIRLSYSDSDLNGAITPDEIIEESNYYPSGLKHKGYNNVINGIDHPYGFNRKEENDELGLGTLDFGARNYDPALMRWMNLDPLAEQMRRHSPYNYAFNDPLRFIDPDGMSPDDVIIKGTEKQAAFKELQASVSSELILSMDKNGKVAYTQNGTGKLSKDAKQLTGAIDDSSVTINVNAENTTTRAAGDLYIGGAFSGNTVTEGANGNTVSAEQEVNPDVLNKASTGNGNPGADMLHEVTEAYQGGLISQKSGVSSPAANKAGSVYSKAHRKATSQSGSIYETLYDGAGNVLQMTANGAYPTGVKKVEWSVKNKGNTTIIQTIK